MKPELIVVSVIAAIVAIVGTVFGVSNNFVLKNTFEEYKVGRLMAVDIKFVAIDSRLDRMENKIDALLLKQGVRFKEKEQ